MNRLLEQLNTRVNGLVIFVGSSKEMKFTVTSVAKSGARIGCLTDFARFPSSSFDTPLLLLHTRGGSVPHLSHDLLKMVTTEKHLLQLPLVTLYENIKNIKAFGKGMAEFAGLENHLFYATVQDSGNITPEGYHDKNSISLWSKGGRKLVNSQDYMQCMEALKPDMFQALADGDTNLTSSMKRVKKSVDASVKFATACASFKKQSEVLKDTPMLVSISGGYNIKERLRCIMQLKEADPDGFIVDGLHTNGETATNLNWDDVRPILTETLTALPEAKIRIIHGAFTPLMMLHLVEQGIDIFDATFPWLIAEKGGALVFPNVSATEDRFITETLPTVAHSIQNGKISNDSDCNVQNKDKEEEVGIERSYDINLKEKIYFNDFKPLLDGCSCYCCRKYTRSYVHHLLTTSELLGPMLLMMHNLHHYLNFVANIRKAIKEDQLEILKSRLEKFLESRRDKTPDGSDVLHES